MAKRLKVLVPFDFSRHSQETLRFALARGKDFSASFLLLYVVPSGEVESFASLGDAPGETLSRRIEEARAELEQQTERCRAEFPAAEIASRVVAGVPFKEICRLAEEENFELIVIGTHGRTGLSHLLIGSTAERVVQHASCPVLSLKPQVL